MCDGRGCWPGCLAPIAGVRVCVFFMVRKKLLAAEGLYRGGGEYKYSRGFHWIAGVARAAGAGVAFIGLLVPPLRKLYDYAWFVGFFVSFMFYYAFMTAIRQRVVNAIGHQ